VLGCSSLPNRKPMKLKWSWLLSELQHAPKNFERAEGDEYCVTYGR